MTSLHYLSHQKYCVLFNFLNEYSVNRACTLPLRCRHQKWIILLGHIRCPAPLPRTIHERVAHRAFSNSNGKKTAQQRALRSTEDAERNTIKNKTQNYLLHVSQLISHTQDFCNIRFVSCILLCAATTERRDILRDVATSVLIHTKSYPCCGQKLHEYERSFF